MSINQQLMARDLNVLWHPCTQMKDHERLPVVPIKRGKGVWLEDFDGHRYIDAVSSWWVNLFGHSNDRINQAIQEQLSQLEHVILAGFSHEPIINLSEQLVDLTPDGLTRCFYADNGSSGVEVALKMSFHYWRNQGIEGKNTFVSLSNSYHGETLAALAVSDCDLYKKTYEPLLMSSILAPSPDCYFCEAGESWEAFSRRQFEKIAVILEQKHQEIAAVIVEPLVQCAGSMRMYHPIYLTLLKTLCEQYHVHLIADEIAVGFGRTGTMFACEQAAITPDFMCLSKGLTGGYLPLSVVLTNERVYEAFYDDYETQKAFLHSHSYTGNPLGCAAALATIGIFNTDNVLESNQALIKKMQAASACFNDHPHVGDVRQTGMILAIEMVQDKTNKTPYDWRERRGLKVFQYGLQHQVLLRPLGNVIYVMPPYVITPDEIDHMIKVIWEGINMATA